MEATLKVDTAPLDATCKGILRKMVSAGFNKANEIYTPDSRVISESDLAYLMRHGGVSMSNGTTSFFSGVLQSYAKQKFGRDAGKLVFTLRLNLE